MTRLAILGAGPVGLEAALAAAERGFDFAVYEAAPEPGGYVRRWSHVRTFTPWDMNVSPRMAAVLGDDAPSGADHPTGAEVAGRLLDPIAERLGDRLSLSTRVLAVGRRGLLKHEEISSATRAATPFRLLLQDADGAERIEEADMVIDATGTYGTPNRLGDGGIDAPGERAFEDRIERFLVDVRAEPERWAGKTVLLTGAGHSAQTAARDLAAFARDAAGTRVIWAVRSPKPTFGAVEDDPLPARRSLNASALELLGGASDAVAVLPGRVTEALRASGGDRVTVTLRNGDAQEIEVDRVMALNGGVGDASIYRQLQIHECYASLGPMRLAAALLASSGGGGDCLEQASHGPETLRNPEPGFFILGAKSYGRNSQFLLRVGWEQVDDVFQSLLR